MNWRIYRLPGSRENWLIDHGPNSMVLTCHAFDAKLPTRSVNGDPAATPRAWIAVNGAELHLSDGVAIFTKASE